MDGGTSTAAELNLLDGSSAGTIVNSKGVVYGSSGEVNATTLQIAGTSITSTAAELNILDGVTATATELNLLDGVTATTAELNYTDGVTSNIQTQLDAKQALDSNLTSFVGVFTLPTSDGSADQILKTNGSGTLAFADPGGGMHTLLSTVTASGASTVDIGSSSLFTSTYDQYYIYSPNISSDTNDVYLRARVSNGAFQTSGYKYAMAYMTGSSDTSHERSSNATYITIIRSALHGASQVSTSLRLYLNNPSSTSLDKLIQWHCDTSSSFYGDNDMGLNYGAGYWGTNTQAIQGLRLYLSSGNITGNFYLFGVSKS